MSFLFIMSAHCQLFQSFSSSSLPSGQSLALTGQMGMVASAFYCNHLPEFGKAYISQSIGFEKDIANYNGAWGVNLYHEALGNGISTLSQLSSIYCYKIKLRDKQQLSLALRLGVSYSQLNVQNALTEVDEFIANQYQANVLTEIGGAFTNLQYGFAANVRSPEAFLSKTNDYYFQPALSLYFYYSSSRKNERDFIYLQQLFVEFQKQGFAKYTSSFDYRSFALISMISYPFYTKSPWVGVGVGIKANQYKFRYFYNHPLGEAVMLPFSSHQIELLITFKKKQGVRRH